MCKWDVGDKFCFTTHYCKRYDILMLNIHVVYNVYVYNICMQLYEEKIVSWNDQ